MLNPTHPWGTNLSWLMLCKFYRSRNEQAVTNVPSQKWKTSPEVFLRCPWRWVGLSWAVNHASAQVGKSDWWNIANWKLAFAVNSSSMTTGLLACMIIFHCLHLFWCGIAPRFVALWCRMFRSRLVLNHEYRDTRLTNFFFQVWRTGFMEVS